MNKINTTLKIVMLCVICAATLMTCGCVEEEDPVNTNDVEIETVSANDAKTGIAHVLSESDSQTPTPLPTSIPTVPTTLELIIGHTAFNSKTEVTVISVHKKYYYDWRGVSGNMYSEEADHGNTFVFALVNMKNVGRNRDYLGSHDLSITDSEGFRYDRSYMSGDNNELDSHQELYQNQQMEGIVMFEVPKDATGLKIQYDFGNMFGKTQIASWTIPDRG